jgi:hypothetical protein
LSCLEVAVGATRPSHSLPERRRPGDHPPPRSPLGDQHRWHLSASFSWSRHIPHIPLTMKDHLGQTFTLTGHRSGHAALHHHATSSVILLVQNIARLVGGSVLSSVVNLCSRAWPLLLVANRTMQGSHACTAHHERALNEARTR